MSLLLITAEGYRDPVVVRVTALSGERPIELKRGKSIFTT